jgi:hypothetical protein
VNQVQIIWDLDDDLEGNYWHIVMENGVTKEEYEEVWFSNQKSTVESRSTGRPITFGWTTTGKYLAVVWEHVHDDPWIIFPVTAYPVNPPTRAKS